jgi:hypothetical protein
MAKKEQQKTEVSLPFNKINYILFFIALVDLVIGFYFQSIGPADSFQSRTLAPIILVLGFLVIMPTAIMYRGKKN